MLNGAHAIIYSNQPDLDRAFLDSRMDRLEAKFNGVKDGIASTKVWAFLLYLAFAAGMLGTMARGFGWI
jgi:hypothetical protein